MHTHISNLVSARNVKILGFTAACVMGSFLVGIRSAGEVHPFEQTVAQQASILHEEQGSGDVDGDGRITLNDAVLALEMSLGETPVTEQALLADPDADGSLTANDALSVLHSLTSL